MVSRSRATKRVVAITGVSRGLGRALAGAMIEAGHHVAGCARSADAIRELHQEHDEEGTHFAAVDVTDAEAVTRWADDVAEAVGVPDLLINNAGVINRNAPLWEVPPDAFGRVVDVNLKGVHHVVRAFAPRMISEGRGLIANISSGWGRSAAAEVGPYCATKWAIEAYSQTLAQELPAGLAAVAVNPGVIDTDMLRSCFGDSASSYPDASKWARRAAPFFLAIDTDQNGQPLTVH